MTPQQLENIIDNGPYEVKAIAYAALNLMKILGPSWTHYVPIKEGKDTVYKFIDKAPGETFGNRKDLEKRLMNLLNELSERLNK